MLAFAVALAAFFLTVIPAIAPDAVKQGALRLATSSWRTIMMSSGVLILFSQVWERRPKAQEERAQASFYENHIDSLRKAIINLEFLDQTSEEQLNDFIRNLLTAITSVVYSYYDDTERKVAGLNANYMLAVPVTAEMTDADFSGMHFKEKVRTIQTYSHILVMEMRDIDGDGVPDPFALPVDKADDRLLFGTPWAFKKGDIRIIRDTKNQKELDKLLKRQPGDIKDEVREYFRIWGDKVRSVVSIPLGEGNNKLGVLNIHSCRPTLFGASEEDKEQILSFVMPFCDILTICLRAKIRRTATMP